MLKMPELLLNCLKKYFKNNLVFFHKYKGASIIEAPFYFSLILQVFIPRTVYNGQKLIKLVNKKTPAKTSNI